MKKFLLILGCLYLIGITSCSKEGESTIFSNNAQATGPNNGTGNGNGRPVLGVPMNYANWEVGLFLVNQTDLTSEYLKYVFHFDLNNVMTIARLDMNRTITGSWQMTDPNGIPGTFTIQVNPGSGDEVLSALNGTWTILSFDVNSSIELMMGTKRLRLNRA